MSEQSEQIPAAEVIKAEKMLTPEEKVYSEARYEVMKHQDSFVKAGVSKAQVQNAAVFASETALKEYKDLIEQNPWKTTTDILTKAIEGFQGDDKVIAEEFLSGGSNFPTKWKDKIEWYRDSTKKTKPNQSFKEIVSILRWNNWAPTYVKVDEMRNDYPSLYVMDPRNRSVFEKDLSKDDPRRKDLLVPSAGAVRSIFEAFGADVPTIGKQIDNGELIETKLPGVFLSVIGENNKHTVLVNFSVDTLEKIVTLPHETK